MPFPHLESHCRPLRSRILGLCSPRSAGRQLYPRVHLSTLSALMGSDTSAQCCRVAVMNSLAWKLALAGGAAVSVPLEALGQGTPSALQISDFPARRAHSGFPTLPLLCFPKLSWVPSPPAPTWGGGRRNKGNRAPLPRIFLRMVQVPHPLPQS